MVVSAPNTDLHSGGITDIPDQQFCIGTFYLHLVLGMTIEKGLETIIVLALALLIAYLSFDAIWFLYGSLALLIMSILSKKVTIGIAKLWFSFSYYLGMVMNFVIMFLVFYLILTPLAFFQRLSGKNQIHKKHEGESYFYKRNHIYTAKDIEKPW